MKENFKQWLISLDQFVFCTIAFLLSFVNRQITVYADLTISAQSYRLAKKGYWYGKLMMKVIDFIFSPFEKEHCLKAYESEKANNHLPNDML